MNTNEMCIIIIKLLIIIAFADIALTLLKIIFSSIKDTLCICKAIVTGTDPKKVIELQKERSERREEERKRKSLFYKISNSNKRMQNTHNNKEKGKRNL